MHVFSAHLEERSKTRDAGGVAVLAGSVVAKTVNGIKKRPVVVEHVDASVGRAERGDPAPNGRANGRG